jgi:hypothetical protein
VEGLGQARAVELELASERPMRVGVQLRAPARNGGDARWGRSIVIGPERVTVRLPLDTFVPVSRSLHGPPDAVEDLLLVVDRVNTPRGAAGTLTLHAVRLIGR